MSSLICDISVVEEIMVHPNAERLELARVKDWVVVTGKGRFQVGEPCVYIPIDSVLPPELEAKLFPPDSKIKLDKSRVRTIKIRSHVSQGMICKLDDVLPPGTTFHIGMDVTALLGITKYEPPEESIPPEFGNQKCQTKKKLCNPLFHKYTDIENAKNFPTMFIDGEEVNVTEKLHGTSFRCGYFPTNANTVWKKIKRLFGFLPAYEFCYGSRNVQLQDRPSFKGYYSNNVYAKVVEQYDLKKILAFGQALYGEIVGDGIQKGYTYGCKHGEHKLFAYDVSINGEYIEPSKFRIFCEVKEIPTVPHLYTGPFDKEKMVEMTTGSSVVDKSQKVREGVVVKSTTKRKLLKYISDAYLLKADNTDFH